MTRNPPSTAPLNPSSTVDVLILGSGWTGTFLIPLLDSHNISYAATSTTGRDGTIPFKYDPSNCDEKAFQHLPTAQTVLITFPLVGPKQSRELVGAYMSTHPEARNFASRTTFIQLGSTRIFSVRGWNDEFTPYDRENSRAIAEDELLAIAEDGVVSFSERSASINPIVLNLAGLYGGARQPKNWLSKVAGTKEKLAGKEALHLIHGHDVARAVLLCHLHADRAAGKRWIITDLHVYDWWDLATSWDHEARGAAREKGEQEPEYRTWVRDLMDEKSVRALPRPPADLGRVLDGRAFWRAMCSQPEKGHVLYETSEVVKRETL